jgi:hypothetical protein
MQQYVSGLGKPSTPKVAIPVNALEVTKALNKTKIRFLPQPVQDIIYEYAADTTVKNQFIKAIPQIFRFGDKPSLHRGLKFTFSKDCFHVNMTASGLQYVVTQINSLQELSDYVYKHARRWWVHETEYDVNDKMGSLLRILRSTYNLPTVHTLHIITSQTFQLINYRENEDIEYCSRMIVPSYLRSLVSVSY